MKSATPAEEGRMKEAHPPFLVLTEYVCGCSYHENRMAPLGKRELWPHRCRLAEADGRMRI